MVPMGHRLTTYQYLREQLKQARRYDESIKGQLQAGGSMHVDTPGKVLAGAYEQLRNAAEYADGSITLQRAIRRFYKRTLLISHHRQAENIGRELIVELILSGYLPDGSIGKHTAEMVAGLVHEQLQLLSRLKDSKNGERHANDWTLAILSARTYDLLVPHAYDAVLAAYACQYFLETLPGEQFIENPDETKLYADALYVAVHQGLLQSGIDTVRADLLRVNGQNGRDLRDYIRWNNYALELYTSPLTLRLKRVIVRNGAPFRVLRSLAASNQIDEMLANREQFLQAYHNQIGIEYSRLNRRLNTGVLKSVAFLFLTKVIIGVGVEVPFDRYIYGAIAVLPLAINLLFPPLYMASIRFGLSAPSVNNAADTVNFMDRLLYGEQAPAINLPRTDVRRASVRAALGFFFLMPFAVTLYILQLLGFNPLQMGIFLVFFSTASFLGFRLSLMVRELRMTSDRVGVLSMLRDLFYLPFILFGQWLASRYAQINVVGEVLDLVIELPLKSVLALVRQWMRFLSDTHEQLY